MAAGVVATSGIAVQFSTRVKPFVLEALITVALTWVFFATTRRPTMRRLIVCGAAACLALILSAATAPVASVGLSLLVIVAWGVEPRLGRVALGVGIGYAALLGLWYVLVLSPAITPVLSEWWSGHFLPINDHLTLGSVSRRFAALGAGLAPGNSMVPRALVAAGLGALVISGAWSLLRRRDLAVLVLLLGPIVAGLVLAVLSISPFGGGRTDLVVYPLFAVLAALGVDAITSWLPQRLEGVARVSVVAIIAAALLATASPATYPSEEDGRAITRDVLAQAAPDELIVTLPETSYLWARYTPDDVGVVRDEHAMTGFTPTTTDRRVLLLSGFELGRGGPANLEARSVSLESARSVISSSQAEGVWVVMATFFPTNVLPELDEILVEAGYSPTGIVERPFAEAVHWHKG